MRCTGTVQRDVNKQRMMGRDAQIDVKHYRCNTAL